MEVAIDGDRKPAERPASAELLARSEAARERGEHEPGLKLAEAALASARAAGDADAQAAALSLLGTHFMRLGEIENAIHAARQALRHYLARGDALGQSRLHSLLALAYVEADMAVDAMRHALEALRSAEASGDLVAQCWAWSRMNMAWVGMGEVEKGFDACDRAEAIARRLGRPEELFLAIHNSGTARIRVARRLRRAGENAGALGLAALPFAEEAVALAKKSGNTFQVALATSILAAALDLLGRFEEANRHAEESLSNARTYHYRVSERVVLEDRAQSLLARVRLEEAIAVFESLWSISSADADHPFGAHAQEGLYRSYRRLGRFEQALTHHEKFHQILLRASGQRLDLQGRLLAVSQELDRAQEEAERARHEAQAQRRRAEELDRAAHRDALTGLPNRRFVDERMPRLAARAERETEALCAALLDIDHFKQVNDRYGHAVGDRVLVELARILASVVRERDFAARYGGEEFLLAFVGTGAERAIGICERLRESVEAHDWACLGPGLAVTVSLGIATLRPGEPVSHLLVRADVALYEAKGGGRNRLARAG